jgi:hypothetical protein
MLPLGYIEEDEFIIVEDEFDPEKEEFCCSTTISEDFCSLILYQEPVIFDSEYHIENSSPPSLITLSTTEYSSFDQEEEPPFSYQLLTASEEFQNQHQIESEVQRTLLHCIYLFSSTDRCDPQDDLRTLSIAPVKLLFTKIGYFSTVSRMMMQEFIDLFKTLKMIVEKVNEAKQNGKWSLWWNYSKWSQDVVSISNEVRSFFQYLDTIPKNKMADDSSLLHYSPNIRIKPIGLRLRPSVREKTREYIWKKYFRPISMQALNIQWFLDLFLLFDRYLDLRGPVDIRILLEGIKLLFDELTPWDQQDLIIICEDVLGGRSISHISANLLHWVRLNKDIIPQSILYIVDI